MLRLGVISLALLSLSGESPENFNRRHGVMAGVRLPSSGPARELLRNYYIPDSADPELVREFYDSLETDPLYARRLLELMDGGAGYKLQVHHVLAWKNGVFSQYFERIAKRYGRSLDENWNKLIFPQRSNHPIEYHLWVLERIVDIDERANGDVGVFDRLFEDEVLTPLREMPGMLNKSFWEE